MNVYRSFDEIPYRSDTVLTIGTFDGVHSGHRVIIDQLKATADTFQARSLLLTFDPHPQIVLRKTGRTPLRILTTIDERLELMRKAQLDSVLVIPFTKEFARTNAEDFVREYLVKEVGMRHIFIGHDHMFGKDRKGSEKVHAELSAELGYTVDIVSAHSHGQTVISSTKIRNALTEGRIEEANAMLGYDYMAGGTVIRGDGRGASIGLPTANIALPSPHKLLPKEGVYCVSAIIDGQKVFGMANIGRRPTFTNDDFVTLETHFLDFDKSLYDKTIAISFLKFMREERKFASLDLFLAQIETDRRQCQDWIEHTQLSNK